MSEHAIRNAKGWLATIVQLVTTMHAAEQGESDADPETIREEIEQGPLSIQVRSGWYSPGDDERGGEPEEYEILLSTGGPALRIYGELERGQPDDSPRLQWQDWGTPWTDYTDTTEDEDSALATYAGCFWFGE